MNQKNQTREKPAFWKKNCKFAHTCHLFTKTSTTCTKKGNNYCGAYRELTVKLQAQKYAQPEKQTKETEITFLINPDLYEPITTEAEKEQ